MDLALFLIVFLLGAAMGGVVVGVTRPGPLSERAMRRHGYTRCVVCEGKGCYNVVASMQADMMREAGLDPLGNPLPPSSPVPRGEPER